MTVALKLYPHYGPPMTLLFHRHTLKWLLDAFYSTFSCQLKWFHPGKNKTLLPSSIRENIHDLGSGCTRASKTVKCLWSVNNVFQLKILQAERMRWVVSCAWVNTITVCCMLFGYDCEQFNFGLFINWTLNKWQTVTNDRSNNRDL